MAAIAQFKDGPLDGLSYPLTQLPALAYTADLGDDRFAVYERQGAEGARDPSVRTDLARIGTTTVYRYTFKEMIEP